MPPDKPDKPDKPESPGGGRPDDPGFRSTRRSDQLYRDWLHARRLDAPNVAELHARYLAAFDEDRGKSRAAWRDQRARSAALDVEIPDTLKLPPPPKEA